MTERQRIVSLLPSCTEIACALGLRDQLVGRSHECDFPPGIDALPALTQATFEDGRSREIDDRVRDLVERGLSVYRVDADRLRELGPTLVLTQDQCQVCAASLGDVERALAEWVGAKPEIVSLSPQTLGDVLDDVETVGRAAGCEARASALRARLTDRITGIGERSGGVTQRPRVACIEWIDPLMTAGNWMPELVAIAGGRSLFGSAGQHSPCLEWSAVRDADPDVLLVIPCGFDVERTRAELPALTALPGFASLRAVREGRVFLADGNAYFNRSGPRLVESLEILAEILHPDRFDFGHAGRSFEGL